MDSKLTLKLDQSVIERAKQYAAQQNLSLSKLVEFYFDTLTSEKKSDKIELSPFVKSISTGKSVPLNLDSKKEYSDFLLEKYK